MALVSAFRLPWMGRTVGRMVRSAGPGSTTGISGSTGRTASGFSSRPRFFLSAIRESWPCWVPWNARSISRLHPTDDQDPQHQPPNLPLQPPSGRHVGVE